MALQNVISGSIVVGQSTTNRIVLNELSLCGITTGSNLTATTLTFLVSVDGVNFYPLYDNTSTEVSLTTTTAARAYNVSPAVFYGWNYLKIREGNSASAVNQATVNTFITLNSKKMG